jgi:hypothetical protein
MLLAASLKLLFLGYLFWTTWKRVIAENAAEKIRRGVANPGN